MKQPPKYSVVIPVYNRPDEVAELLESLCDQTYKNFEIIIVEDGSKIPCKSVCDYYADRLNIRYFFQENAGPAIARNTGSKKAESDWLVFFDSDCIIPTNYFVEVNTFFEQNKNLAAFGGPDKAHSSFSNFNKAISYSMTAFLTTGGIRGGKTQLEKFHPRSFNMGIKKNVFESLSGFSKIRFGEDIDLSARIINAGYKSALISNAFVYHKRRSNFRQFFKQIYNSGIARINHAIKFKGSLKPLHLLPSCFVLFVVVSILISFFNPIAISILGLWMLLILLDSTFKNKSLIVGLLSVGTSFIQLFAYGLGFIDAFFKRILFKKSIFSAFDKTFYD